MSGPRRFSLRSALRRHPRRLELMAFHDGELAADDHDAVARHVAECRRCEAHLDGLAHIGAVVRGDAVPGVVPPAARRRSPAPTGRPGRVPALLSAAAVVALVVGLLVSVGPLGGGDDTTQLDAAGAGNGDAVRDGGGSDPATRTDDPSTAEPADPASGGDPSGPSARHSGSASTTTTTPAAVPSPARGSIALGMLVPGGQTGAGLSSVHAVASLLQTVNESGGSAAGLDGVSLRLEVADADDPDALAELRDRGVRVVVGGWADPAVYAQVAGSDLTWFGPADVVTLGARNVVPVELDHATAGRMLGEQAVADGAQSAVAISGTGDERALVHGLRTRLAVEEIAFDPATGCADELEQAGRAGADAVVLALAPDTVQACLALVDGGFPIRRFVVPSTAADAVRDGPAPAGTTVVAALGAPLPTSDDEGAERFRRVTGQRDYRALVSFAAAEAALKAIERSVDDPLAGFLAGGFRSDLLTLDAGRDPVNIGAQVVVLAASPHEFTVGNATG